MGRKSGESAGRVLFEELEPRMLLDGNVTVNEWAWWSGDMKIKGDAATNDILITPGPNAYEFYVQGRNNTTVNGQPWVLVKGAWDDIKIKMKQGHDLVEIQNCAVSDEVEFKGGGGNDRLYVNNSTIWGKLKYSGNWGGDSFSGVGSWFDSKVYFEGGQGSDSCSTFQSTLNRGARASASRGHTDWIYFQESTFNGWVSVYLGAGDDFFALYDCTVNAGGRANGGSGWDDATLSGSYPTFYLKNFEA